MADYSLVHVDYQPNFDGFSLVPVDYDPFAGGGATPQAQTRVVQAQTQQVLTPTQPAQTQPESPSQQPATGVGQPNVGAPAAGNSVPSAPQGGSGLNPSGGDTVSGPSQPSNQGGAEPAPFSGYANPTPKESLVNTVDMDQQEDAIKADPKAGRVIDGQGPYKFVTTKLPIAEYPTDGGAGWIFTTDSPFYAKEGDRTANIDASPQRPVTVTIKEDGTFTISRP